MPGGKIFKFLKGGVGKLGIKQIESQILKITARKAKKIGKTSSTVLQAGGHTLQKQTLKALGLTKEQANKAIHTLKDRLNLPPNLHGKIMSNGDYLHPTTGELLDNLYHYIK